VSAAPRLVSALGSPVLARQRTDIVTTGLVWPPTESPAHAGDVIVTYCAGLGLTSPAVAPKTTANRMVTVAEDTTALTTPSEL